MLVLSRKLGEEILIGSGIRVRVLEVRGNRVKLGFDAPGHIRFVRSELAEADAERAAAARLVGCTTSEP